MTTSTTITTAPSTAVIAAVPPPSPPVIPNTVPGALGPIPPDFSVQVPHFDLPFRFDGGHAAVVEQDSLRDVTNCVAANFYTYKGTRPELPDFGVPDITFEKQPVQVQPLIDSVLKNEPRAIVIIDQHPDVLDSLIADLTVGVSIKEAKS